MRNKTNLIIIIILLLGIIYRLFLTGSGNFLFNMDNARDMVDVREMIELKKLRLTGPTSAIEGLFNGPAWYYLLAIPYIISGGDPYGSILMEVILWAIGGYFLLKLTSDFGKVPMVAIGSIWIASNYVVLTNLYAFNPNPVILLTPFFIYLLKKYLETSDLFFSISTWFLAGLFFNFEMNVGVFIPLIIFLTIIFSQNYQLIKTKTFWVGIFFFMLTVFPQILFDLRHDFLMTKSVLNYIHQFSGTGQSANPILQLPKMSQKFFDSLVPTFLNLKLFIQFSVFLFFIILIRYFREKLWRKNYLMLISLMFIFVPLIGYTLIPVTVNSWHLGAEMAAAILLFGFILKWISHFGIYGKLVSFILSFVIIFYAFSNISNFFLKDFGKESSDPSLYKNEIAAIDYVYKYAKGQNFKVYTYLPSVIDYPYQYLFWWYGKKQYGYIPYEYAYSPNVPPYISNKEKFAGLKTNYSGLVFLIKEPDRIKMRRAWEDDFDHMELINKEVVGPLEIEIRKER